jgi:hypothetical protein
MYLKSKGRNLAMSRTSKIVGLALLLLVAGVYPVHGFDGSDLEIPRVEQLLIANSLPIKPSEPVALVLKISDDKNWVKIEGPLTIGFSYRLILGRDAPPNCSAVTSSFSKLEAIEIGSARATMAGGRKSQSFWLVGYLPAKRELVGNCAEYRDFSQAPIVIVNSTSFRTSTPKGSNVAVVSGGVYTPKLTDESGRSAQSSLTTRVQEFQFLPGIYTYAQTYPCLSFVESVTFREKNQNALNQFETEAKVAFDLSNQEGQAIYQDTLNELKKVDSWSEFVLSPSMITLRQVPSCSTPSSSAALIKVISDARLKIKASNDVVKKSNLLKRCELFQAKYLDLEKSVLLARDQYRDSKMKSVFSAFSLSTLKVDCSSNSLTDASLTAREIALTQSAMDFENLGQRALREVICEPFAARIQRFSSTYKKISLKFQGSRFQSEFPAIDFESLNSACKSETLVSDELDLMKLEFDQIANLFTINSQEAERQFKLKKLIFKITCVKGSTKKLVTNRTGICPSGTRKN